MGDYAYLREPNGMPITELWFGTQIKFPDTILTGVRTPKQTSCKPFPNGYCDKTHLSPSATRDISLNSQSWRADCTDIDTDPSVGSVNPKIILFNRHY